MVAPAHTLHRLIYRSRQTPAVCDDLDFEVGQIIRSAIRRNRDDNLTGLLVCFQGLFVQVLEGPQDRLWAAYGRILKDTRHFEPTLIEAGAADRRLFGDWTMCARTLSPSDSVIIEVLDANGALDPVRLTAARVLDLLTTVAELQRRTALAALTAH